MKKLILSFSITLCMFGTQGFSQTKTDSTLLGLPGDNLDLYAVLDLFQKSKTIEEFEKNLNIEKTGINNLDLDVDGKVDFIKVVTKKEEDDFTFILQVAVSKEETQDVAVILVSKDKAKKVTMQIVGDKALYGKDYIVDMKESKSPSITPNPGYKGPDTVFVQQAAKTTTVIVESAPIVQYVYSPAYVPYYPPYYYGFYPPYFMPYAAISVGIYFGMHAHYHGHYHGGYHGNTMVVHNHNTYNNYNRTRNSSNTVEHHRQNGDYNRGNGGANRPSNGASASQLPSNGGGNRPNGGGSGSSRPTAGTSDRPMNGGGSGSSRPSAGTSDRPMNGGGGSASTRPSAGTSDRSMNGGGSAATRPSNDMSNRQSPSPSTRQSGGGSRYSGGGGYGGGRGGGGGGRGGGGRR